jgi:hypothetical protein
MKKVKKFLQNWGWYIQAGTDQRIRETKFGGTYVWCADPQYTNGKEHLVKFGNNFDHTWRHPDMVKHDNWHFWDNPELSHLLYPSTINPRHHKNWIRWVKGEILTSKSEFTDGEKRINWMLRRINAMVPTWQDLVRELDKDSFRPIKIRKKTALMVTSTDMCHWQYYKQSRSDWAKETKAELIKQGYEVFVRNKNSRKLRTASEDNRLYKQIKQMQPGIVVNQHSASTIEALCTGTPVVVRGKHCGGPCVTEWKDFVQGADPKQPNEADFFAWMNVVLGNIRHKTEIVNNNFRTIGNNYINVNNQIAVDMNHAPK